MLAYFQTTNVSLKIMIFWNQQWFLWKKMYIFYLLSKNIVIYFYAISLWLNISLSKCTKWFIITNMLYIFLNSTYSIQYILTYRMFNELHDLSIYFSCSYHETIYYDFIYYLQILILLHGNWQIYMKDNIFPRSFHVCTI